MTNDLFILPDTAPVAQLDIEAQPAEYHKPDILAVFQLEAVASFCYHNSEEVDCIGSST